MPNMAIRVAGFAVAALLVFAQAGQAAPGDPQPVTILAEVSWSPYGFNEGGWGPNYWGDFETSGAMVDDGGAYFYPWYPTSSLVLYGSAGTIQVTLDSVGNWFVQSGTGDYDGMQGGGTYVDVSYTVDDPLLGETYVIEFELEGTVTFDVNLPPEADLVVESVSDLTARFSAAGSQDSDGTIVSDYEWDLDGDGIYDAATTAASIEHTYAAAGTYWVTVRVSDDDGATDTATTSVSVEAPPPPPDDEKPGKGKGGGGGGGKGKKK
jgi:hypothetical protein